MEPAYIIEGMNENTIAFLETRFPQAGDELTNELSRLVTGYRPSGIFDVNVDLPRSIRWSDDDNVEILIVHSLAGLDHMVARQKYRTTGPLLEAKPSLLVRRSYCAEL